MKAIEFKEQNIIFAKDQPEYIPLPVLKLDNIKNNGEVISCWQLSFKERVKMLFTGKMWVSLMMFGKPLTPMSMSVNKKEIFEIK